MSDQHKTSAALPVPRRVEPTLPPPSPAGNWLLRGVNALRRGELPYRARGPFDRVLRKVGVPYRRLHVGGFTAVVRRNAPWDEAAVMRILRDHDYQVPGHEIRPTDTVIDIGGNIGCFALVAGRAASQGRVFVFEPDAGNFAVLSENLRVNRLTNVIAERWAVSGESGTLTLYHGAHGPLHTTIPSRLQGATPADQVRAVTLPEIMDMHGIERCNFLKLNCEGAEYAILYNTPQQYLARVDRIALEYHASETQDKSRVSRELAGFLQAQGFDIFEFTDFVGFDCGYIRGTRNR